MPIAPHANQQANFEELRSKLMMACALCAITETYTRDGFLEKASACLGHVRATIADANRKLQDADHIAVSAAPRLHEILTELEHRFRRAESAARHFA